jgi:hypothetical protein
VPLAGAARNGSKEIKWLSLAPQVRYTNLNFTTVLNGCAGTVEFKSIYVWGGGGQDSTGAMSRTVGRLDFTQ